MAPPQGDQRHVRSATSEPSTQHGNAEAVRSFWASYPTKRRIRPLHQDSGTEHHSSGERVTLDDNNPRHPISHRARKFDANTDWLASSARPASQLAHATGRASDRFGP